MEDAYGIGVGNRFYDLCDTEDNDLQAILKDKARKAKKAAKKLAVKENKNGNVVDENKGKFFVPGKKAKQSQPIEGPPKKTRSMIGTTDTQNIQLNEKTESGNRRNYDNRENRDQRHNRRNNDSNNLESTNNEAFPENNRQQSRGSRTFNGNRSNGYGNNGYGNNGHGSNGYGSSGHGSNGPGNNGFGNDGYRSNESSRDNRTYNENKNNENSNNETVQENGQPQSRGYRRSKNNDYGNNVRDMEHNEHYSNQRDRDDNRNSRRPGNFGNRRFDGHNQNFNGRNGKREFDRQSGSDKTGVKAVEKREGGGARNWGSHKQDIEDLNPSEPEVKDDGNSVELERSEEASEQVVEQVFLTLDEYKQQQADRPKPVYNTRKAGEGEDKKKWKNLVPLQKKKEDGKSEEEMILDMSQWPQRKRRIRSINDINVRFNEVQSPGFNNSRRGNRKTFNGRRNDAAHGQITPQIAPRIDDRNFPTLG